MGLPYPDPALRGSEFVLRPFRADDFGAAVEMGAEDDTAKWVPAMPAADASGVMEFVEQCRREGEMLHLVIADHVNDTYLGEIMVVIGEHHVGELGCGLVAHARGRGIATEALRLLASWSLSTLSLGRVQVFVAEENTAAIRLAERAGFHHEGMLRSYIEHDGVRFDTAVMSLVPGDLAELTDAQRASSSSLSG